jgi:hypothetical protein
MSGLLIDYSKIVSKKHSLLLSKLSKPPPTPHGSTLGLVVVASSPQLARISQFPEGSQRVDYLNNPEFVRGIRSHYYVFYSKEKKLCVLDTHAADDLPAILNALFSGFPKDTILWVSLSLEQQDFMSILERYISNGFNSPYICKQTPLRVNIQPSVALARFNSPTERFSAKSTLNKVVYAMEQYKDKQSSCSLYAQINSKALSFLKKTSKIGITLNKNGKKSQKELTGVLFVKEVVKKGGRIVYIIDVDESTVQPGSEEEVDVSPTRYNFHSHPHEAYVRHSVDKAWPSLTDYLGYIQLGKNTIFHCVATLEGLYVMSFGPYWGNHVNKISKRFIEKNFHIDHKENYTPQQYVDKINKIRYKKRQIYVLKFFTWPQAGTIFQVSFSKDGMNCFATEKGINHHRKIHS